MWNHKLIKRFIAAAVSVLSLSQFCLGTMPDSVFAVSFSTDYVIYSDENITVNTNKAVINGNVFSGDDFNYLGKDICYITKTLNSDNSNGNVQVLDTVDVRTVRPDYIPQLKNGVNYRNVYSSDTVLEMTEYDLSSSVSVKGNLRINRTAFSGKGYIRASGNIQYNAVQNNENNEIFLYSSDGNIDVQGSDLTINGVIYAPNGTVELNAKNLTFNGVIIAQKVEINGTNLIINEIKDKNSSLLQFGPEVNINGIEKTYKENRKITLDISESFGINDIDTDSLIWSFTSQSGDNSIIKTDETSSSKLQKNLIITDAGIYNVSISGKDKNGKVINYYETLNVVEDTPPVAGFWRENSYAGRNSDGKAEIVLEDTSYSLDGDTIGSRVWSVLFDSDNDGDFSDETEEIFNTGNETKVTYIADSVGKYKFRLSVAEVFTDTIKSLVSEDAFLIDNTDDMELTSAVTEVGNNAPVSYSGISKAKNVDIVLTVGNTDLNDINAINRNVNEIKSDLEEKGYSVNLSAVSTSTLTAKDTFAWEKYDHYNYKDSYLPTLKQHILYEGDSIKMVGYGAAPLRDWLFVDDGINSKRNLSFEMIRDRTDWHSMEGGGFLFNTTISDEVIKSDDPEVEDTTIKKMSGYCILLTSGGFKLIQLKDVDVDKFRDGRNGSSVQNIGKVLMSVPVADAYENYNVRIVASSRLISVYINDQIVIDNFVLPDDSTGNGFGPIICHGSHGCAQQSYFTFSNIKMSTINGSELGDVLDKYKWRESAEHYVINLSKDRVYDLADQESIGAAVKSLIENQTNFIGLGTADSKAQYDLLLKSADGVYMDWYDVIKNKDLLADYILNDLTSVDYCIDGIITTSDEIAYENSFVDVENDSVGQQQWSYDLNADIYENSTRQTGLFTSEKPLTTLEATGLYKISSRICDDPTNNNAYLDPYRKWSNEAVWTEGLLVHSKPVATMSSEVLATDDPGKFLCNLSFDESDADALSHENKGITAKKFEWKYLDDSDWREGIMPKTVDAEKVCLQKYIVCDEQNTCSTPCIETVFAHKQENTEKFIDNEKPKVTLTVSDENPCVDDQIVISVMAKDNTEVAAVTTTVNGKKVCEYQGSIVYDCNTEGKLVITSTCRDISGNETVEVKNVNVSDRRDLTAPEIIIDNDNDISAEDGKITISGSVKDDRALKSYTVEYAPNGSDKLIKVLESSEPVNNSVIASFNMPQEDGKYNILITAADKAGNTAYSQIHLTLTKETISQTKTDQKTESYVNEKRVDTPADITIEASAEKAEIGDVVIVTADAEDIDGLVSFKVYKDNKIVSESPAEFRFNETEAKVVSIRVETTDAYGGKSQKSIDIIIEDNSDKVPPVAEITSPKADEILSGKITVSGSAYDETGLRLYNLEYKKSNTSTYAKIGSSYKERNNAELGVWDTYTLDNGLYDLRLSAIDNGGNITYYTMKYNVVNGTQATEDQLSDKMIVFSKPQSENTADGIIKIEAQADPSLNNGKYEVYIQRADGSGQQKLVDSGIITGNHEIHASVDSQMYDNGKYTVTIAVKQKDNENNDKSVKQSTEVVVKHSYTSADSSNKCCIISPDDMSELSSKSEIKASVSGDVFSKYKFEYSAAGEDAYIVFDSGDIDNKNEITGKIDTTLMKNGYYDVRFTAYGDGIKAEDVITVNVKGNMKIGDFSMSFNDLDFDVNTLPVTVIRTYDSRGRNIMGDFGYGWNMSYDNVSVTISGKQNENWKQTTSGSSYITRYCLSELKKHRIIIDLGNGVTDEFSMNISPENQMFYPLEYGLSVSYKALNGSKATLVPCDISPDNLIFSGGKLFTDECEDYNPGRFAYTTSDGSRYIIDVKSGLQSITTVTGDTVYFKDDSITASDGKTIIFTHDSDGRITEIKSNSGSTVTYEYDIYGDLTAVTDIGGDKTTFVYENHYLTEIYDARGIRASKNVYDDDGRLIKTIDADGNEITFEHDIDGREEVVTDRNGGITRYIYDADGNIISVTDAMGNTVKNTYDSNGNVLTRQDAIGNITKFSYDENGNQVTAEDAEGTVINSKYNSKGMITSVESMGMSFFTADYTDKGLLDSTTDPLGNVIDYDYDSKGRLTSVADDIGDFVNITYDSKGNAVSVTNGEGAVAQMIYDEDGNCTSKTVTITSDGTSKTLTENYTLDAEGNIISTIDSDGNIRTTEYNSMGKICSQTDAIGRKTVYDYDKFGNVIKIKYSDGTSESFTYDKEGNNLTAADRLGRKIAMTYDKAGNITSKTYANGSSIEYRYDANYNVTAVKSANGGITTYSYDALGRNTSVTDADGNTVSYSYNKTSRLESITDALGNVYSYNYDSAGNLTGTTYPDGSSVSTSYDARSRIIRQTDQHGYVTGYTYDNADRLTSVTDALGNTTSYAYDEAGDIIEVKDVNGNQTHYKYDDFSRVISITDALGHKSEKTYDIEGNVLTQTDFGGKLTAYSYDGQGRLTSKKNDDGTVSYSYTADDKLASVRDKTGTIHFTYDNMDGITKVSYPNGKFVSYTYDNSGRVIAVTTTYGTTQYTYDLLDRIRSVTDKDGNITSYKYDANGNKISEIYANGITVTYDYDCINRLICERVVDSNNETIALYQYTLGQAGERTAVNELDRTVAYSYDELYRLVSETVTTSSDTDVYEYTYDNAGSRLSKTVNGETTHSQYNSLNQLVSEGTNNYVYDDAGNLTAVEMPGKSKLYEYNADNKMIRATIQEGEGIIIEEYGYDYDGNRIWKKSGEEYSYYLNDLNSDLTQVLGEYDKNGNIKCIYTRGDELISQNRADNISYYIMDGHRTVRLLANTDGIITDTYSYDAWGNITETTGDTVNSFLYCGEQCDELTGNYYLRARYMDPSTGTFNTMDTYQGSIFEPVILHKYLYANANPVTNSDPSGYFSLGEAVVVGAIQGALMSCGCTIAMNFLKNLDNGEVKVTCSAGEIVLSLVTGAIFGALFTLLMVYALGIALIITAIGAAFCLKDAVNAFQNGDCAQGVGYSILSLLSFCGLKKMYGLYSNNGQVPISRWGSSGFKFKDWVMLGKKNLKSFFFSFKWDWNPTNNRVPFSSYKASGEEIYVSITDLVWPKGKGIDAGWKWIFGQRQYYPGTNNYDYTLEYGMLIAYLVDLAFGLD